jgi:tetraacyldisaccharide 4'-kinase
VVMDGDRGFGNGRLLPAGPLREAPRRLQSVDAVIVNGGPMPLDATLPQAGALRMRLQADCARALTGDITQPLGEFAGRSVHAIAGIGHPQRFFSMLRSFGIEVIAHPLADHAHLQLSDISFGDDRPVFMTEKDAVKCEKIAGPQHWYVPIEVEFDAAAAAALIGIVSQAVAMRIVRA